MPHNTSLISKKMYKHTCSSETCLSFQQNVVLTTLGKLLDWLARGSIWLPPLIRRSLSSTTVFHLPSRLSIDCWSVDSLLCVSLLFAPHVTFVNFSWESFHKYGFDSCCIFFHLMLLAFWMRSRASAVCNWPRVVCFFSLDTVPPAACQTWTLTLFGYTVYTKYYSLFDLFVAAGRDC